jgi:hypothetical protein
MHKKKESQGWLGKNHMTVMVKMSFHGTDNLHTDLLSSLVYCVGEFLSFSFFFALVLPLLLDNLD